MPPSNAAGRGPTSSGRRRSSKPRLRRCSPGTRAEDARPVEPDVAAKDAARRERLEHDAAELRTWLAAHPEDRRGPSGGVRQSNRTDNESAKLATGKGVIQGYTGVAAVDARHQIIVEAQAHGTGAEQELLVPIVTALQPVLAPTTVLTADAGYHSEANLRDLAEQGIDALIADNADAAARRTPRHAGRASGRAASGARADRGGPGTAGLPARGLHVRRRGAHVRVPGRPDAPVRRPRLVTRGFVGDRFRGAPNVCGPCPLRAQCLRTPDRTPIRQVAFFRGKAAGTPETHTDRMKRRLDTPEGRAQYGRRFATVEPVFGNLRANKRLDRFTLRGRDQGRRAVEAVLPGAQHREARPSRLRRPGRSLTKRPGDWRA